MPVILTIQELESASATLSKLEEVATDDTARAILYQAQLLLLCLSIKLVTAQDQARSDVEANLKLMAN